MVGTVVVGAVVVGAVVVGAVVVGAVVVGAVVVGAVVVEAVVVGAENSATSIWAVLRLGVKALDCSFRARYSLSVTFPSIESLVI